MYWLLGPHQHTLLYRYVLVAWTTSTHFAVPVCIVAVCLHHINILFCTGMYVAVCLHHINILFCTGMYCRCLFAPSQYTFLYRYVLSLSVCTTSTYFSVPVCIVAVCLDHLNILFCTGMYCRCLFAPHQHTFLYRYVLVAWTTSTHFAVPVCIGCLDHINTLCCTGMYCLDHINTLCCTGMYWPCLFGPHQHTLLYRYVLVLSVWTTSTYFAVPVCIVWTTSTHSAVLVCIVWTSTYFAVPVCIVWTTSTHSAVPVCIVWTSTYFAVPVCIVWTTSTYFAVPVCIGPVCLDHVNTLFCTGVYWSCLFGPRQHSVIIIILAFKGTI